MSRFAGRAAFGAAIFVVGMASPARSDSCRVLVYRFQPLPFDDAHDYQAAGGHGDGAFEERGPQIAIWLETVPASGMPPAARGSHVADVFVTARTASFGIGNRAGDGLFGSSPRFPYGARDFVLPVWAFARGKTYPLLVMQNANQSSFGFHEQWSTPENFFCKPMQPSQMVDAVSCPSQNFSSDKGQFHSVMTSLYPPRHDIPAASCKVAGQGCSYSCDSPDCPMLADLDDVATISGATPNPYRLTSPYAGMWQVPTNLPDGDYWVFIEVNKQFDNDTTHNGPCTPLAPLRDPNSGFCTARLAHDDNMGLSSLQYGMGNNLGQPSVVWAAKATIDAGGVHTAVSDNYLGYGPWDHAADRPGDASDNLWMRGIHPPDSTISTTPGSGSSRLAEITDGDGTWRFKVTSSPCGSCEAAAPPPAIEDLKAVPLDGDLVEVTFSQVGFGTMPVMTYQIKYLLGEKMDVNDFATANPGPMITPAPPGTKVSFQLGQHEGVQAQRTFMIGARAIGDCMKPGDLRVVQVVTPRKKFATIEGCFVATAAYGSELQPEVATLRAFRDRYLRVTPMGRALVRLYYGASPPLARAIATDEELRAGARTMLRPLVGLARMAMAK